MSDNLDDDMDLDESFDDFGKSSESKTLGDMWRDNPIFKIGAIIGAALLVFLVINLFTGNEAPVDVSNVPKPPTTTDVPGVTAADPNYIDAIEEINEQDIENALRTGDSSLPVPIEPPVGIVSLPDEDLEDAEDPLTRWKRLQEERLKHELDKTNTTLINSDAATVEQQVISVEEISESLSQQMSSILEAKPAVQISSVSLTSPDFLARLEEAREEEEAELADSQDIIGSNSTQEMLLPAAKMAYAQLLVEANTDVPGPVLAEIMSGPLKGNRILGSFEEQKDVLTLNFDTLVYEDESISIDAIALDPDTTLPALVSEVNHRYFKRIVLPAAAAFVQGLTDAIADSDATTIVISDGGTVTATDDGTDSDQEVASGIAEAGSEVRTILDEIADDTDVLIRVKAGTPFALLFLEPVMQNTDLANSNGFSDGDLGPIAP